jgi:hypothetical protein
MCDKKNTSTPSDNIEFCIVCQKELIDATPRFRTSDAVFCITCYNENKATIQKLTQDSDATKE